MKNPNYSIDQYCQDTCKNIRDYCTICENKTFYHDIDSKDKQREIMHQAMANELIRKRYGRIYNIEEKDGIISRMIKKKSDRDELFNDSEYENLYNKEGEL